MDQGGPRGASGSCSGNNDLGQAARKHVLNHHGLQGHLDSLLGTFRRASRGFSYPFTLQGTT